MSEFCPACFSPFFFNFFLCFNVYDQVLFFHLLCFLFSSLLLFFNFRILDARRSKTIGKQVMDAGTKGKEYKGSYHFLSLIGLSRADVVMAFWMGPPSKERDAGFFAALDERMDERMSNDKST